MSTPRYQQVASKMDKTFALNKNESILPYIPETKWYDYTELEEMLRKYSIVFIKPDKGGGAGGIIKAELDDESVECTNAQGVKKLISLIDLAEWLEDRLKEKRRYIIQQGIPLAQVDERPFDLRVYMQKPGGAWSISGICAKIAAPGKVVTNYCKGGTPCEASYAIYTATQSTEKTKEIFYELYHLSKQIAKTLNSQFKGLRELGIDIGIDKESKIWIFEVNTRPGFQMFRKINPDIYYKIKKIRQQFT